MLLFYLRLQFIANVRFLRTKRGQSWVLFFGCISPRAKNSEGIMSKTPVSTLQEYAAKHRWDDPVYVLTANNCRNRDGVNLNVFTYKVTCNSMSAVGTASTKKEAKHVAAKEMLKLLPAVSNFVQALKSSDGDLHKIDSYYLPGSRNVNHQDIFVNSVGKLAEHCVTKKYKSPKYRDSPRKGPPHVPQFTVTCSIGSLEVEAVANSKKKAKHDAAQAMLDKLVRNTGYKSSHDLMTDDALQAALEVTENMEKLNMLDLKIEKPSIAVDVSVNRAKSLYPSLENYSGVKKTPITMKPNATLGNAHLMLKSSYESLVRLAAVELINENQDTTRITDKQQTLDDVTSLLGLSVEYDILSNTPEPIIVVCKLNSSPAIINAGIGNTYLDARDQAIANLLDSIDIFLS